jgi:GNAT superfamily N-acetyltransferase
MRKDDGRGDKVMPTIMKLDIKDINADILDSFEHIQKITRKWVMRDGSWRLIDTVIVREWSVEKRRWIAEYMCCHIERGGAVFGAFIEDILVGFCCVDGILGGQTAEYGNLTMLFVDDRMKRGGIGGLLFGEARRYVAKLGADKLFISAIPSEETIAFYFKMGCTDASEIVEAFVDSEDDRYLELVL